MVLGFAPAGLFAPRVPPRNARGARVLARRGGGVAISRRLLVFILMMSPPSSPDYLLTSSRLRAAITLAGLVPSVWDHHLSNDLRK